MKNITDDAAPLINFTEARLTIINNVLSDRWFVYTVQVEDRVATASEDCIQKAENEKETRIVVLPSTK